MPNKDVLHPTVRRRIENLGIILLDCALEYKGAGSQTDIGISKEEDRSNILEIEERPVGGNVTALHRARKTNNNRVTHAVGAPFVSHVDDINESDVSTKCGLCEIEKITTRGGEAVMAISVRLMISKSIEGVQQWLYRGVAEALEVVPRTLVMDSGASPISVLTQLCAKEYEVVKLQSIKITIGKKRTPYTFIIVVESISSGVVVATIALASSDRGSASSPPSSAFFSSVSAAALPGSGSGDGAKDPPLLNAA
ncbi:hypothetical protein C7212DRAFT_360260 [Tuber magnatum]|uniref:Uncharacterized protein n=1 Tax=Tuber magnatum TaxID=42249 RepID=A0A317SBZ4_9PEZI|nr:hypothetical protein C7212DRAFT_360260 [Tuber magnatum]